MRFILPQDDAELVRYVKDLPADDLRRLMTIGPKAIQIKQRIDSAFVRLNEKQNAQPNYDQRARFQFRNNFGRA
jgi:hypothetical protein